MVSVRRSVFNALLPPLVGETSLLTGETRFGNGSSVIVFDKNVLQEGAEPIVKPLKRRFLFVGWVLVGLRGIESCVAESRVKGDVFLGRARETSSTMDGLRASFGGSCAATVVFFLETEASCKSTRLLGVLSFEISSFSEERAHAPSKGGVPFLFAFVEKK